MSLFLFVAALYTLNPVWVDVYPAFGMSPATFRIRVIVPRHFDNREICFGYDGPQLKRSCFSLDGWQSRRSWTVYWPLRAGGEYIASAVLTRIEDGKEKHYTDSRSFQVIGLEF